MSTPLKVPEKVDVSQCLLLFGAFCNGNMGDVVQAAAVHRLISLRADQCVWYAHSEKEDPSRGFREGEFFTDEEEDGPSRVVSLTCDAESGRQVRMSFWE